MDPITALLCGAGSASLLLGERGATVSALVFCAALYGVYRATRARAALALMAPLILAFVLQSFWRLVGGDVGEGFVHDAPAFLGDLVFAGTWLGLAVVVRGSIGKGLMGLVVATLVAAVLARLLGALLSLGSVDARAMATLFSSAFHVLLGESRVFVAALLLVVGAKLGAAPAERPVGLVLGAAGMTILVAALGANVAPHTIAEALPWLGWFVGWVLTAVGVASLARNGAGAAGWVGFALVIVQIPFGGGLALAMSEKMRYGPHDLHPLTESAFLGFGGLAVAAFAGKGSPLPRVRLTAACLILAGAHGTIVRLAAAGMQVRHAPGWPAMMGTLYTLGLPLLAAYMVFFAAPPKANEAAV